MFDLATAETGHAARWSANAWTAPILFLFTFQETVCIRAVKCSPAKPKNQKAACLTHADRQGDMNTGHVNGINRTNFHGLPPLNTNLALVFISSINGI